MGRKFWTARRGPAYLPEGNGVAGELNPRMSKDHVADFLGAGGHPSVLVAVREVLDEQEWVVKPIRGLVRLYRINDLQRVVADAPFTYSGLAAPNLSRACVSRIGNRVLAATGSCPLRGRGLRQGSRAHPGGSRPRPRW
jgi:hypothetical protein